MLFNNHIDIGSTVNNIAITKHEIDMSNANAII